MPEMNFCATCECDGKPEDLGDGKIHREENWDCPLLGAKICDTCCTAELAAGTGAPDFLEEMCKRTKKSPQEIFKTCVGCPHGGPEYNKLPKAIYVRPGAEEENKRFDEAVAKQLRWLKGEEDPDGPDRPVR
jgi:hypothetical protein